MAAIPKIVSDPILDAVDKIIEEREVITRNDAIVQQLPRYFTGIACKHGHVSERYTKTRICVECCVIHNKAKNGTRTEYHRKWKQNNKERHRELNKISRQRNPQALKERLKKYTKENPNILRVCGQNRRARERSAEGKHSLKDINNLLELQNFKCANCKKSIKTKFHVDHIMPLAKGGSNYKENIQLLCPKCNQEKHALDPIEWANKNGRLL